MGARPHLPGGFQDFFAEDVLARSEMIATICRVYERFGFAPLETPAVEYLDVLGKYLPESDEAEGGVFAFKDDDRRWLALRYDLTAPLSRVVAQYGDGLPVPYRRYQVGPVWRREKPGPDRFRQFYQCDFDTVGSASPAADAEVCAVVCAALEELGIPSEQFEVRVNNRKVLNGVLDQIHVPPDRHLAVLRAIDKLDRLGVEGVVDLLGKGRQDPSGDYAEGAGLTAAQSEAVRAFVSAGGDSRGSVIERLSRLVGDSAVGREGVNELSNINRLLDAMGLPSRLVRFDPTVVRGLGYYTGAVFEATLTFEVTDQGGLSRSFGSIAGGGRYDDLVKRFTGAEVPATGLSIGVDRLLAALKALGRTNKTRRTGPVVVTVMDSDRLAEYQNMVSELRRSGIAAEIYLGDRGLRAQMKYADRRGAPVVIIAGTDEFQRGEVSIKDMRLGTDLSSDIADRDEWRNSQRVQRSIARANLVAAVREILTQ